MVEQLFNYDMFKGGHQYDTSDWDSRVYSILHRIFL